MKQFDHTFPPCNGYVVNRISPLLRLVIWLAVTIFPSANFAADQLDVWYPRNPEPLAWNGLTYGAGAFVAVGGDRIATSSDGRNWTYQRVDPLLSLSDVIFA